MSDNKRINKVDQHIGARIRSRRMQLEMSQTNLGNKLGVTFQQVQKYEKGANRVGGSRLHQVAAALKVTEAYFFEGLGHNGEAGSIPDFAAEFMATTDGIELARVWGNLTGKMRRSIVHLAQSMLVAA